MSGFAAPSAPQGSLAGPFEAPPKYQLLRVLGSGAMGTVVLARDRGLGRLVALKFLRESCPVFLERFEREARLLARLVHPSIVRVHEFDRFAGRPYLAMDYVRGGNLAQARLDPRELARSLRDVGDALGLAHSRGVVHRDVKPENVLLDGRGRAQLADFGLALERWESRSGRPVAGSLWSMSPEQVRGEHVGPASDVFSLGSTLYRKLTGAWPFRGRSVGDVIQAIQEDAPVPPRELVSGVPRALEAIALGCLAKDPERRPGIGEVGDGLGRFLERRTLYARVTRILGPNARERAVPRGPRIHPEEFS